MPSWGWVDQELEKEACEGADEASSLEAPAWSGLEDVAFALLWYREGRWEVGGGEAAPDGGPCLSLTPYRQLWVGFSLPAQEEERRPRFLLSL